MKVTTPWATSNAAIASYVGAGIVLLEVLAEAVKAEVIPARYENLILKAGVLLACIAAVYARKAAGEGVARLDEKVNATLEQKESSNAATG